ncbi:MAG: MFS transporter, partial [Armatimonadota bacterium]
MKIKPGPKLHVITKAGYGAAAAASCILFTLFYTFGMEYLTDIVKLAPAFAGTIFAVGLFWDAFVDPAVGAISDNLNPRYGRRRLFFIIIAVPMAVAAWLFFTKVDLKSPMREMYYLILILIYFAAYSILETPHLALSSEMTQDYDERTSVLAWRAMWAQIGSIIAGPIAIILVGYFAQKHLNIAFAWSSMAAIMGLACIPLVIASWFFTKGHELYPEKTNISFKNILTDPFRNRPFLWVVIAYTFGMIATTITGGAGMYFLTYVMRFTKTEISIALFVLMGVSIIWIPLIDFTASRLGKKEAWFIFIGIWALAQGIGLQFFASASNKILVYILFLLIGCGFAAIYMLGWSMISDCIEVDEFKTGKRREGIYFGAISFVQKTGCAIAMLLFGM